MLYVSYVGGPKEAMVFKPSSFRIRVRRRGPPNVRTRPSVPPTRSRRCKSFVMGRKRGVNKGFLPIGRLFKVLCVPLGRVNPLRVGSCACTSLPGYCAFVSTSTLGSSKVAQLRGRPCLGLRKRNAIVTIVSSKVSCLGPVFQGKSMDHVTCV